MLNEVCTDNKRNNLKPSSSTEMNAKSPCEVVYAICARTRCRNARVVVEPLLPCAGVKEVMTKRSTYMYRDVTYTMPCSIVVSESRQYQTAHTS